MKIIYGSWNIRFDRQNVLSVWAIFCPFTPPWRPRKSKFWKTEKTPGDIISHRRITINDNHMMCGSWDMKHNRIVGHFKPFFALLPFQQLCKSKFWKNEKKFLKISFNTNVLKIIIISYTVPEIHCVTDKIFIFHFELSFLHFCTSYFLH